MGTSKERQQTSVEEPRSEDILDRQYHEIGIAAVAAACRYLHEPAPAPVEHGQDREAN